MYNGLLTPTTRFEGSFKPNTSLKQFGFWLLFKKLPARFNLFCFFIVIQITFKETGLEKPGRGD